MLASASAAEELKLSVPTMTSAIMVLLATRPRALLRSTLTAHPPPRRAARELFERNSVVRPSAAIRRLSNKLTDGCLIG